MSPDMARILDVLGMWIDIAKEAVVLNEEAVLMQYWITCIGAMSAKCMDTHTWSKSELRWQKVWTTEVVHIQKFVAYLIMSLNT